MEKSDEGVSLEYWLRWPVPVCALIFIIPAVVAIVIIKRTHRPPIWSNDLWVPCWRNLNPLFLLLYRAFAVTSMSFLLYQTVANFGFFVFYFYTQWTFGLVVFYFALGVGISARGCWIYGAKSPSESEELNKFLRKDSEERKHEHQVGFWGNLMQIVYQACAGAVILTDIVFWCILLPFMTGENFRLTLLIGCMHSVNAVFLFLDSALNNLPFSFFGMVYFVLWSCGYIFFQWILHACGVTWWPYPFLELSTPWAPLWYFGIALIHVPCYVLYLLLIKAKGSVFAKLFPQAFARTSVEEKEK